MLFRLLIILATLILNVKSISNLQKNCIQKDVPQKFGIITTTYIRNGMTKMFLNYLQRYAESECPLYDNIYIVWNNVQSPQEMGILQNKHKWKKNVYIMQTIKNSLDFKYIIPPWAKQQIFFSMDDDFGISCQTLTEGFNKWKSKSYGQLGPLTSFYGRSFVFNSETQSFTYIDQIKLNKKWKYYHFGLTGIAFISRHFLDLYYSDIFQIKQMRKQVVEKMNCQDLLLNFLISYIYPQLIPQYLDLKFQSFGMVGVSATKTHGKYRADCISKFSQILGYNPVRYTIANTSIIQHYKQQSTNLHQKCMVNLKQQYYQQNFVNSKAYYLYIKRITGNFENPQYIFAENQKIIKAKNDINLFIENHHDKQTQSNKQTFQVMDDKDRKLLQEKQIKLHFGSKQKIPSLDLNKKQNQFNNKNHQKQSSKNNDYSFKNQQNINKNNNNIQKQNKQKIDTKQIAEKLKQTIQKQQNDLENNPITNIIYLAIFTIVFILFIGANKYIQYRSNKYHTVPINSIQLNEEVQKRKNIKTQI